MMQWTAAPKCGKCRRAAPLQQWGRWFQIGQAYVPVQPGYMPDLGEALLLTCERCGWQWLMALAPPEAPTQPSKSKQVRDPGSWSPTEGGIL